MVRKVKISKCGKYRYMLMREWDKSLPKVMFIMLNPSTADGEQDDPTIRRCIGFAKDWGYGGISVFNIFPYISTDPKGIHTSIKPNLKNRALILQNNQAHKLKILAWGNNDLISDAHIDFIFNNLSGLHCLGLTKLGNPKHPVRLSKDTKPIKI